MDKEKRFLYEKEYLEKVKKYIEQEIEKLDIEIVEIPKRFVKRYSDVAGGDEDLIENLVNQAKSRRERLIKMLNNCYFGEFAFNDDKLGQRELFYLGKASVFDENGELLVLDWRAPIASLYYEQDLGNVKYTAGDDVYFGVMDLKSQIRINNGTLDDIIDTEIMTKDELILPFLKVSATDKMKDIVASIQKEQNHIIREPLYSNLIIQGVAGSGKTSVALHRIAFLLYQYSNYKADQFLIIGPNKCFNNYTSMVLPDLNSDGIDQITFNELLEKCNLKIKVIDDCINNEISKYKSSLEYKYALDKFLSNLLDRIDFNISLYGVELISMGLMQKYLNTSIGSYKNRINVTMNKCVEYIKSNEEELLDKISNNLKAEKAKNPNLDIPIFSIKQDAKKQLQKGCKDLLKKEFSRFNYKTLDLYKKIIENLDKLESDLSSDVINDIKENTLTQISKKTVDSNDVPALLYLSLMLEETKVKNDYVHVVVDEAQDYGLFQYDVLKQLFPNSTFSIFGDLGQSIYGYKSINCWEELNDKVFSSKAKIAYLNQSYRTTKQITLEANKILGKLSLQLATPVLRNGLDVSYLHDGNVEQEISDLLNKNYSTVALICKTKVEADNMFKKLYKKFENVKLVKENDSSYSGGLCIIDVCSSKGLEFDSVVINNASENCYSSSDITDQKKLYVAMTRALHELKICFNNELTETLDTPKIKVKED